MASKKPDKTFWLQHIARYKASDLTRAAYCREHGLKIHQLAYHFYQTGKARATDKGSDFARVVLAKSPPSASARGARLLMDGKIALEFDAGVDPAWVACLVAAVGGRP